MHANSPKAVTRQGDIGEDLLFVLRGMLGGEINTCKLTKQGGGFFVVCFCGVKFIFETAYVDWFAVVVDPCVICFVAFVATYSFVF